MIKISKPKQFYLNTYVVYCQNGKIVEKDKLNTKRYWTKRTYTNQDNYNIKFEDSYGNWCIFEYDITGTLINTIRVEDPNPLMLFIC